ncbi:MAG TPA: histidine kinase [Candidatus Pelethocola excrementipullorum]|nr:histidine kinase [Candidatus Pelethocola excrementipullorum]
MMKRMKTFFYNLNLQNKLILIFLLTSVISQAATTYMNGNINQSLASIDRVYTSNAQLNDLASVLNNLQNSMKDYLDTKTSYSLTSYYEYEQKYRAHMDALNQKILDNDSAIMEKNIYSISGSYLEQTGLAVEARRARNISQYKVYYDESSRLFDYLNANIFSLNNEQFMTNSSNYVSLAASLRMLERMTGVLSISVSVFNILLLVLLIGRITKPLRSLAEKADEVATGNFEVEEEEVRGKDEIGVVTNAFNKMVVSIRQYIVRLTESIEAENAANERELLMKAHLKDAQLKYYQAQIHPHFLFNTLNAGAQMAMMEEAEKTYLFIQRMSEFFRYSMNGLDADVLLEEELTLVENYIYIMSVRFSEEIHYEQNIQCDISDIRVPSMILQPVVENSIQYGIRDIDWEGKILLSIEEKESCYIIEVKDNGIGIPKERLKEIHDGHRISNDREEDSNGIGLGNLMERLKIYYNSENLFRIESEGLNQGTRVTIELPKKEEKQHV